MTVQWLGESAFSVTCPDDITYVLLLFYMELPGFTRNTVIVEHLLYFHKTR